MVDEAYGDGSEAEGEMVVGAVTGARVVAGATAGATDE